MFSDTAMAEILSRLGMALEALADCNPEVGWGSPSAASLLRGEVERMPFVLEKRVVDMAIKIIDDKQKRYPEPAREW